MKKITLLLLLVVSITLAQRTTNHGLIASYSFDNPNNLNDNKNVRNLSQTGNQSTTNTGKFGQALTLGGDYFTGSDLPDSDIYTYSFWLKTSTNTAIERTIIDDSTRPGTGFGSGFGTAIVLQNGKVSVRARVFYGFGAFRVTGVTSTTLIADGNWHHIVIEVKKSGNVVSSKIIVDKVVGLTNQTSAGPNTSLVNDFNTVGNFVIGDNRNNTVGVFNRYEDEIDELKIFDIDLTASQINILFNNDNIDIFRLNDIDYVITKSNEVEVLNYSGSGTILNIPNQVTNNGITYNVTAVDATNFRDRNFTSVTIPNGVISIGNNAFQNNQIVTLNLGTGLQIIGTSAFLNNKIATLIIPNNVRTIGQNAFKTNRLTEITLGSGLRSISGQAFIANTASLTVTSLLTNPFTLPAMFDSPSLVDLIIPTGTSTAYSRARWRGFKSITEGATLSNDAIALDEKSVRVAVNASELTVSTNNNVKVLDLAVYQLTGKQVLNVATSTANINTLASGVYIINITTDKGVIAKKIIKN